MSHAPDGPVGWLATWIARQLRSGAVRGTDLKDVAGEAIYVYGSIGVDAALTSTGEIWVGEYDLDAIDATGPITWRRALGVERLGYIVIATRRFPALAALLPARPVAAVSCPACRATGDWHMFSTDRKESLRVRGMICKTCGGLGWQSQPVA